MENNLRRALLPGYSQASLVSNSAVAAKQIYHTACDRSHRDHCDVIHTFKRDKQGEEVLKKVSETTKAACLR
jgi:hypothetical protein